jgi:hypothetical protein
MMVEKYINFPVKILDKRIPKKELLENLNLNSSQKKYLKEIEKISILFLLNKDTINILPFIDEIYDYSSILVLEVTLKSDKHLKQLSSILQLIPQNLMIFFIYDDKITLSLASKRINKNDPTKMVIEKEYIFTFDNSNDLAKLDFSKAIKTNLFVFYRYYIDLIVSFELKKHSINDVDENILEKIKEIENKINLLKKELKQAVNINEKVEINMEIHRLKEELNRLKVNYVNMD